MSPAPRRVTDEQVVEAYRATGSVWKAGKVLGIVGQSVHERLRALGHRLSGQHWSDEEETELAGLLAAGVPIGEAARRLGRTYAAVAMKASRNGVPARKAVTTKVPRGAGFDKASVGKHLKLLRSWDGSVTKYAIANGMNVNTLVVALQRHFPVEWEKILAGRTDVTRACVNCGRMFFPASAKQKSCTRKCASDGRRDRDYFGGKRSTTVGLAEGICQLCERQVGRGLSCHHVIGKENDPENDLLIALCPGCHKLVTLAASRTFVDNKDAWENFIGLAWMRKHGSELKSLSKELWICVDIDLEDPDE